MIGRSPRARAQHRFAPWALIAATMACQPASAQILYRHGQAVLFDGRYGPIAHVQSRVAAELAACGRSETLSPDGFFGRDTRTALGLLAKCPRYAALLADDPDARNGALTARYWAALTSEPVPSIDARARTIMLSYERTDYTRMEWNFCQSSPLYDPAAGRPTCFSNDPKSYLTWGPNGATAGNGREVQHILMALDAADAASIDLGFGAEAGAVRRMFALPDKDGARSLETYLCGIWASPTRRTAWRAGFAAIGQNPATRVVFDRLYQSASLDGGKIAAFHAAYAANGLVPTEIDYAFFKDRAAHSSVSQPAIAAAIASLRADRPRAQPWQVRQAIALAVRPGSQRVDRLGRDVAFYIDGAGPAGLSREESDAWNGRGRLRASDAGLSDARIAGPFAAGPALAPITATAGLNEAERGACPAAVLATQRPEPK